MNRKHFNGSVHICKTYQTQTNINSHLGLKENWASYFMKKIIFHEAFLLLVHKWNLGILFGICWQGSYWHLASQNYKPLFNLLNFNGERCQTFSCKFSIKIINIVVASDFRFEWRIDLEIETFRRKFCLVYFSFIQEFPVNIFKPFVLLDCISTLETKSFFRSFL